MIDIGFIWNTKMNEILALFIVSSFVNAVLLYAISDGVFYAACYFNGIPLKHTQSSFMQGTRQGMLAISLFFALFYLVRDSINAGRFSLSDTIVGIVVGSILFRFYPGWFVKIAIKGL